MASQYIRSSLTDTYDILSSYSSNRNEEDVAIVANLVSGGIGPVNNNLFTSPANNTEWSHTNLNPQYVDTSVISNYPVGSLNKHSAISLEHTQSSSIQSYSSTIGNNNVGNVTEFKMLPTSAAFYDSCYVFETSYLSKYYDTGIKLNSEDSIPNLAKYEVTFDTTNSNHGAQYAVNSQWNTTNVELNGFENVGPAPISVKEDADFNENSALGKQGDSDLVYMSKYATLNTNGSITFTDIDINYQPIFNNLDVVPRENYDNFNIENDIGIFAWVQNLVETIRTSLLLDESIYYTIDDTNTNLLNGMPFMNVNAVGVLEPNTLKTELNPPGYLRNDEFFSIFNTAVSNTITENYTFRIDIVDGSGGYYIDEASLSNVNSLMTNFDNSNLLDNPLYMNSYVYQAHTVTFSDAEIRISHTGYANTDNVDSFLIDLTYGETLLNSQAGNNGEIKLQTNEPNKRVTQYTDFNLGDIELIEDRKLNIYVNYSGSNVISETMMTSPYLFVKLEKIVLRSESFISAIPESVFASSNGATLTYYTNEIANNAVDNDNSDFIFNENNIIPNDDNIRLWRIDVKNTLTNNPQSLYSDYDEVLNMGVTVKKGLNIIATLQNVTEELTDYESYRSRFTSKRIEDIQLYNSVQATNGDWNIEYSNTLDTFLKTDVLSAFNDSINLPFYNDETINFLSNNGTIYAKYEYKTVTSATVFTNLQDYVEITYSQNSDFTDETTLKIQQQDINKVYSDASSTTIEDVTFAYTLTSTLYPASKWKLVKVIKTSEFSVKFDAHFGPYSNITLGIENILQTNSYYALQNITTSSIISVRYVTAEVNLKLIDETISGPNLTLHTSFTFDNLKPFWSVIQGRNHLTNTWENISDVKSIDIYYNSQTVHTLTISKNTSVNPDVTILCEYLPFEAENQQITIDEENYFCPLIHNSNNNNYIVSSFTSSPIDVPTCLDPTKGEFNISNNYYAIRPEKWIYNMYTVSMDILNDSAYYNVYDLSKNLVFTVKRHINSIFFGIITVSHIPLDVWKTTCSVGLSIADCDISTSYETTNYLNNIMKFTNIPGIEVINNNTNSVVGSNLSFRVLADLLTVNTVGLCSDPTLDNELGLSSYNGGLLNFQYGKNQTNYSCALNLTRFRGYAEPNTPMIQTYEINRDSMSATFKVGSELQQVLTTKSYYNQTVVVNNLVNNQDIRYADLNTSFGVKYSIPPTGAALIYNVIVIGDNATINITNEQYTGTTVNIEVPETATPVVSPISYTRNTTLKTAIYDSLYTFSGQYYENNKLVSLKPSRLRLRNALFAHDSLRYSYNFLPPTAKVYKAINNSPNCLDYLGDPTELFSINSNKTDFSNPFKWKYIIGFANAQEQLNGVNIGKKTIKQNQETILKDSVSYFVSLPPQFIYETVSTENNINTPYDYNVLPINNKIIRYLPHKTNITTYNPFASIIPNTDINGNNCNITNDSRYVNNITIKHLNAYTSLYLTNNFDLVRHGIIVPGTNLSLTLYVGDYNNKKNPIVLYNSPITSMISSLDVLTNNVVMRNRATDGSVVFSVLQKPSVLGLTNDINSYKNIFKSDDHSKYYQIDFSIGNIAWNNKLEPSLWFNAMADGFRPTLYTVVDLHKVDDNYRRVYKYSTYSAYDLEKNEGFQTLSFSFNNMREYYDVVVSKPAFSNDSNGLWSYSSMLNETNIGNLTSIPWIQDTDFSPENPVIVNWSFGNTNTAKHMPIDLFYTRNDEKKFVFITLLPFLEFKNQFDLPLCELAWDGNLKVPSMSSRVLNLQPQLINPSLEIDNTYSTGKHSIASLNA